MDRIKQFIAKQERKIDVILGLSFIAVGAWSIYLFFTDPAFKSPGDILIVVALSALISTFGIWHLQQAWRAKPPKKKSAKPKVPKQHK